VLERWTPIRANRDGNACCTSVLWLELWVRQRIELQTCLTAILAALRRCKAAREQPMRCQALEHCIRQAVIAPERLRGLWHLAFAALEVYGEAGVREEPEAVSLLTSYMHVFKVQG
jgi:hypothetical protein